LHVASSCEWGSVFVCQCGNVIVVFYNVKSKHIVATAFGRGMCVKNPFYIGFSLLIVVSLKHPDLGDMRVKQLTSAIKKGRKIASHLVTIAIALYCHRSY
jgi:hypothetical protein